MGGGSGLGAFCLWTGMRKGEERKRRQRGKRGDGIVGEIDAAETGGEMENGKNVSGKRLDWP